MAKFSSRLCIEFCRLWPWFIRLPFHFCQRFKFAAAGTLCNLVQKLYRLAFWANRLRGSPSPLQKLSNSEYDKYGNNHSAETPCGLWKWQWLLFSLFHFREYGHQCRHKKRQTANQGHTMPISGFSCLCHFFLGLSNPHTVSPRKNEDFLRLCQENRACCPNNIRLTEV